MKQDKKAEFRERIITEAKDEILDILQYCPPDLWLVILSRAVAETFRAIRDAKEIEEENKARRQLE